MASAVICLSKGQRFNFSKYIFDSMVRNVDSSSKFYMYPRFIQLIIQNQVGDLSTHTTCFISPALTQKVFANMIRVGKGFSGVETPLFDGMLTVRQPVEEGVAEAQIQVDDAVAAAIKENVAEDVAHDAIPSPPSNEIPSPSHEPSSPPQQPQNSPQASPKDAEFPTQLQQVLNVCSALSKRVENLENDNAAQKLVIIKLKARVKKLEKANQVKSSMLRRLRKVGASKQVESSDDMEDRYQGMKKRPQTESEARKNMMIYLKNTAGYQMDFFKGMTEEMEEEDQEIVKSINKTPAQKAAKRRKLSEEAQKAEDLRKRLDVVEDENDDVFIEATQLASKDNDIKIKIQDHKHENEHSKGIPKNSRLQVSRRHKKDSQLNDHPLGGDCYHNPMDDEPIWAVDRVVALTPGSAITIPETVNEFAIKDEDSDALLDKGSKILYSIEGTILEEKIFAEFDEFMAMSIDENSESNSKTEEPPFKKITYYKIKTSLGEPPSDIELKPLPNNLEYVFLEEPSFLLVIISF
nr:reverse transcriptase domain-containing protein [Tanacetum cinerariifolium]